MLKKSAPIRFLSNLFGLIFQILTIFFITKYLDIYQFALWGVASSLIYIFSVLNQFGFVQNIEKYFPNYNDNKKIDYFSMYMKTQIATFPVWLFVLLTMNYLNFFTKYNAENFSIFIALLIFTIICESLISIYNPFFITINQSRYFDLNNLLFSKFLKFFVFFYLLTNDYSVYYLLLFNFILRALFLATLLIKTNKLFNYFLIDLVKSKIIWNNFSNTRYSFFAYIDKTLYVSFINFLFLISTIYSDNETISHFSFVILIINNLRPIFDSLPGLLTKKISEFSFKNQKSKHFRKNNFFISSIIFSTLIVSTYLIGTYTTILEYFLGNFEVGIFKLIFLSVFISSIHSFYYPIYLEILYKNNEISLVTFNLVNYTICTLTYLATYDTITTNYLYTYLFYEILNIFFVSIKFIKNFEFIVNFRNDKSYISLSIFPILVVIFNLIIDLNINSLLPYLALFFVMVDVIRFSKLNNLFFYKKR